MGSPSGAGAVQGLSSPLMDKKSNSRSPEENWNFTARWNATAPTVTIDVFDVLTDHNPTHWVGIEVCGNYCGVKWCGMTQRGVYGAAQSGVVWRGAAWREVAQRVVAWSEGVRHGVEQHDVA